jgi:hypothetical protein
MIWWLIARARAAGNRSARRRYTGTGTLWAALPARPLEADCFLADYTRLTSDRP